jgi:hypothetical protein
MKTPQINHSTDVGRILWQARRLPGRARAQFAARLLLLCLVCGALSGCWEAKFDPDVCFSLKFHRYQLGKFIIDTPIGLRGRSGWDNAREREGRARRDEAFVSIMKWRDRPNFMTECQRKDHTPYDTRGRLDIWHSPAFQLRNRELELYAIALPSNFAQAAPGSDYQAIGKNLFKVSEIGQIKVVSEVLEPPSGTQFVFGVGERRQKIYCNTAGCQDLAVQDEDGLIYLVEPDRYTLKPGLHSPESNTANNGFALDSFNITPAADVPETILPVVNFARTLRNRAAEGAKP